MTQDPEGFSAMTAEELVSSIARDLRAQERVGRACAELHDRFGWTWQRIGDAIGSPVATVHRWAKPYASEPE